MSDISPELQSILNDIADQPSFCGFTVDGVNSKGHCGETPLHIVASWRDIRAARLLLEAGADPNAHGEDGETPLHCAVLHQDWELAKLLLAFGASKEEQTTGGSTPLDIARICNYKEGIALLSDNSSRI